MAGKVDVRELKDFAEKLKRFDDAQRSAFFEDCSRELAARLLRKVVKRTAVRDGTLKRGWTGGTKSSVQSFVDGMNVVRNGNTYTVTISNNVSYASYVELGHRTRNHKGWVKGQFMLQISINELKTITPRLLEKRINQRLEEVFG
jgi:hypothetical protein